MFGSAPATSAASAAAAAAVLPQYMSLAHGSMLEHLRANNGTGGLVAMSKAGIKPSNGFSHHPVAPCLPHLLLPEGLLNANLQVKDLLSPSPIDRNLLFVNETTCSAARTRYVCVIGTQMCRGNDMAMKYYRPLVRRVNRKVVRKRGLRARNIAQPTDVAFHPHLSMAHGKCLAVFHEWCGV